MRVHLWSLPGPRRLVNELVATANAGRSILLLHPANISLAGLNDELGRRLRDRPWFDVDLEEMTDRHGTLAQRLIDHLGEGHLASSTDMSAFVRRLRSAVVWLRPAHDPHLRKLFPHFLSEFSAAAARQPDNERPTLVCVAPPELVDPLPAGDACLLVRHWWGQINPLDTLVAVDETMDDRSVVGDREVIAELAAWDLEFAARLALNWDGDVNAAVARYAPRRFARTSRHLLEDARTANATPLTSEPPQSLYNAWAAGCVDSWGHRVVVHIRCHSAHSDEGTISRRVWRGQVAAILPFIEVAREHLASWTAERLASVAPKWQHKDITSLEAGQLANVFMESPKLGRFVDHNALARNLRDMRHRLAHLHAVDRETVIRTQALLAKPLFS